MMSRYHVQLRYFPGDAWGDIREKDLRELADTLGLTIGYEKIENRERRGDLLMENTMDKTIEEISQEVITVSGDAEEVFSEGLKALFKKYRCPRTVYSLLGSNEAGKKIADSLMDLHGGW
jgi:hypothetical protein